MKFTTVTNLSEQAVQRADEHQRTRRPAPRRRGKGKPKPPPAIIIRLHPDAWREAMRLADGNARRIAIHSTTEFTVTNR
jgi:hypothetical protein